MIDNEGLHSGSGMILTTVLEGSNLILTKPTFLDSIDHELFLGSRSEWIIQWHEAAEVKTQNYYRDEIKLLGMLATEWTEVKYQARYCLKPDSASLLNYYIDKGGIARCDSDGKSDNGWLTSAVYKDYLVLNFVEEGIILDPGTPVNPEAPEYGSNANPRVLYKGGKAQTVDTDKLPADFSGYVWGLNNNIYSATQGMKDLILKGFTDYYFNDTVCDEDKFNEFINSPEFQLGETDVKVQDLREAQGICKGTDNDLDSDSIADIVGDGLCDDWENTHFGDNFQYPFYDQDGDGLSNIEEQCYGLNPNLADSGVFFSQVGSDNYLNFVTAGRYTFSYYDITNLTAPVETKYIEVRDVNPTLQIITTEGNDKRIIHGEWSDNLAFTIQVS